MVLVSFPWLCLDRPDEADRRSCGAGGVAITTPRAPRLVELAGLLLDVRPHRQLAQPVRRYALDTIVRPRDLTAHGRRRIGVVAQVGRAQDGLAVALRPPEAPLTPRC